jgi:hypothetical protein
MNVNDPKFGIMLYTLVIAAFPLLTLGLVWLVERLDADIERRRSRRDTGKAPVA